MALQSFFLVTVVLRGYRLSVFPTESFDPDGVIIVQHHAVTFTKQGGC